MEEKKSKEVKMEPKEAQQKLTYEQLNDACSQLFQQNQQLARQLNDANMVNMFKRLDYLFKAVELSGTINDPEFINSCIDEIKEALYGNEKNSGKEE